MFHAQMFASLQSKQQQGVRCAHSTPGLHHTHRLLYAVCAKPQKRVSSSHNCSSAAATLGDSLF